MTRTKGASQAPRAGAKDENEPPEKHASKASKQAAGRQSREVLLLLNTAVRDINSGGAAGGRARGRTSVADVKAEPQQLEPEGRGKKGLSAPPAPEVPVAASQQVEAALLDAKRADAAAKTNKKRAVGTAATGPAVEPARNVADSVTAAAEDGQEHGAKKRKVSRGSDSGKVEGQGDAEAHQAAKPKQKSSGSASAAAAVAAADAAAADAAPVQLAAEKKRKSKGSGDGKAADEKKTDATRHGRPAAACRVSHDNSSAPASESGASQAAAGSGAAAGKQQGTKRQTERAVSKAAAAAAAGVSNADSAGEDAAVAGPSGCNAAAVPAIQMVAQAEAGAGSKRAKKPEAALVPALPTMAVEPPRPAPQVPAAPTGPSAALAPAAPAPVPAGRATAAASTGAVTPNMGAGTAAGTGAARQLPVTGTTPVKIVPMPMPRMDEVGQRERSAVVELQRQLAELRGMYDELKSTKIQELEKVLAEQMQNTEEQVRLAEQRAKLWQAAAEHAEQKAKAAGSEEVASRIASLEAQVQQLLAEKGELLLRVAKQDRELAQAQQAAHDMRAELLLLHQSLDGEEEAQEEGAGQAQQQGGAGGSAAGDPMEVDGAGNDGHAAQGPVPPVAHGTGATPGDAVLAAGRRTPQLPSASPNTGVLFPTPGTQLVRLRGLLSNGLTGQPSGETPSAGPGVSTECLRIVNMLPSLRAVSAEDGSTAPLSGGATGGTGLNTHCQRVVNMLPQLRAPTPSIQSRLASGAVPLALQSEAAAAAGAAEGTAMADATPGPSTANGADQPAGHKSRRSNGSPIDGICGADQRKAGAQAAPAAATATADMSFAHGMGAPEGFHLPARHQDQYSFVDLNPASVRKGPRPAEGPLTAAAQVAFAAATALPRSPIGAAPARSPLPPRASPRLLSPSGRTPTQAPNLAGFSPRAAAAAAIAAARAALAIDSGNVSNQGSCSGLVARAAAQQEGSQPPQAEAEAATGGDGSATAAQGNNGTPMSVHKQQPTPSAGAAGAVADEAAPAAELLPALSPSNNNAGQRGAPGTSPSPHAAKLVMYEQLLDWHVEAVSLSPPVCRLTHLGSGASIMLRETELDEDELADLEEAGGEAVEAAAAAPAVRPTYVQYTPLQLGALEQYLPEFYQDEFKVPAENRRALLEGLDKAIKEALQQQQLQQAAA